MIKSDLEREWLMEKAQVQAEKEHQYELDLKEEFELKPAKIKIVYVEGNKSREIQRVVKERIQS